tara:strand:+ start:208 stop:360 length:153 start_codon:yes stop_codon:yes gene_type:complete
LTSSITDAGTISPESILNKISSDNLENFEDEQEKFIYYRNLLTKKIVNSK